MPKVTPGALNFVFNKDSFVVLLLLYYKAPMFVFCNSFCHLKSLR